MRLRLTLILILFLQGCSTLDTKPTTIKITPQEIPNIWQTRGRIGAVFNGKAENAGFDVVFNSSNYKLELIATLSLGKITIESKNNELIVDKKHTNKDFRDWMITEMGWYFPISDIGKIVFNNKFSNPNWALKILSYHPNNHPKTIRLTHKTKNIKIKLVFKDLVVIPDSKETVI